MSTSFDVADLSYAAALIDGEGCIHMEPHRSKRSFVLTVRVANTDLVMIDWMKSHFGGFIISDKGRKNRGPRKICYQWTIKSKQAGEFLELVLPYLKIKVSQAKIGIILQRLKATYGPNNLGRTEEQVDKEVKLANTLQHLKVVGSNG